MTESVTGNLSASQQVGSFVYAAYTYAITTKIPSQGSLGWAEAGGVFQLDTKGSIIIKYFLSIMQPLI